jgi:hypothetical protein
VRNFISVLAFALLAVPRPATAQDGAKWKPCQFKGHERYEYKVMMIDGGEKKESGYVLEVTKKGPDDWDIATTVKTAVKAPQLGAEQLFGGSGKKSPGIFLMNPFHAPFLEQVEMKDGAMVNLSGAGVIKVGAKETVGGRSGFTCKFYTRMEDKDVLGWEWTIDPDLALPIKSVAHAGGQGQIRIELVSYKKD